MFHEVCFVNDDGDPLTPGAELLYERVFWFP